MPEGDSKEKLLEMVGNGMYPHFHTNHVSLSISSPRNEKITERKVGRYTNIKNRFSRYCTHNIWDVQLCLVIYLHYSFMMK